MSSPITPADIKHEIVGLTERVGLEDGAAKPALMGSAVLGVALLAGAIYVAGQRRGKKFSTIVEVHAE